MNAGAGGNADGWIVAVNLIIWTGIFLYLLHLNRKLRDLEKDP
jgi:CcmD family protein